MSQEVAPMQAFTEKLQDKIRNDIAGMLPDEVIKAMVEKATQSLFFERKTETVGGYNDRRTIELPSFFENLVKDAVKPIIEQHVKLVMAEQKSVIETAIKDAIDKGMMTIAIDYINSTFKSALLSEQYNFTNALTNQLRGRGIQI